MIRAPGHPLYIQVPPDDKLSKQFGPRSGKISIENINSMQRVKSTGHGLNTSEFVDGSMPPAKVPLRWSVKDFRRI